MPTTTKKDKALLAFNKRPSRLRVIKGYEERIITYAIRWARNPNDVKCRDATLSEAGRYLRWFCNTSDEE